MMRYRYLLTISASVMVLAMGAQLAMAATITINVPEAAQVQTVTAHYQCADQAVTVDYINASPVSLAVLYLPEGTVVASQVPSGSGARYASQQYIWWSVGNNATLANLMEGGEDSPTQCTGSTD